MDKGLRTVIGIGFLIVVIGGILYVAGQMGGMLLGRPELVIAMETSVTKVIFPAASISGLLCFVYYYIFPMKKKEQDD